MVATRLNSPEEVSGGGLVGGGTLRVVSISELVNAVIAVARLAVAKIGGDVGGPEFAGRAVSRYPEFQPVS